MQPPACPPVPPTPRVTIGLVNTARDRPSSLVAIVLFVEYAALLSVFRRFDLLALCGPSARSGSGGPITRCS
jgi:hypothetical protein